jgi:hypothetical protein
VEFFSQEIAVNGVTSTLEKYIFDEEANADGRHMLTRVVSGAYVVLLFTLENHPNYRIQQCPSVYPNWSTFSKFV